jgi:hypothetical protein
MPQQRELEFAELDHELWARNAIPEDISPNTVEVPLTHTPSQGMGYQEVWATGNSG